MRNKEGIRLFRGPANDTVPAQAIRNKETMFQIRTYRGIPGNDLAIGQSQETLVNSCLIQLWQADKVAR